MRRGHGGEEEETGCESKAAGPGLSPGVFCEEVTERRRQRKSEKERREEENTHGQKNEEGGYPELSGWTERRRKKANERLQTRDRKSKGAKQIEADGVQREKLRKLESKLGIRPTVYALVKKLPQYLWCKLTTEARKYKTWCG